MFDKVKGRVENHRDGPPQPVERPVVAQPTARPESSETISCISSGTTIVGRIVGDGVVKVLGRVEGELYAANVVIHDGAQVEADIIAQDLAISGRFKGTIHAVRVKLHGTALVEGDIFHRSLSIEENARFEGSSRWEDKLPEIPPSAKETGANPQPNAQPQMVLINGGQTFKGATDHEEMFKPAE